MRVGDKLYRLESNGEICHIKLRKRLRKNEYVCTYSDFSVDAILNVYILKNILSYKKCQDCDSCEVRFICLTE
jgi:hypothetical protein